jgi:hypothetical protein
MPRRASGDRQCQRRCMSGTVSLWDTLTLMHFAMGLAGATVVSQTHSLHGLALVPTYLVGALVGIACVWMVRTGGTALFGRIQSFARSIPAPSRKRVECAYGTVYL